MRNAMSGSGGWPVSALPGYLRRTERCPAWCSGPHSTRRLLQSPLLPAPVQCPLHCPALPGVMCYAHNNNVMCHNPDIDVKFCKNIWRSGYGPCQGLSRVNLQCAILLKHHRCHRCQNWPTHLLLLLLSINNENLSLVY